MPLGMQDIRAIVSDILNHPELSDTELAAIANSKINQLLSDAISSDSYDSCNDGIVTVSIAALTDNNLVPITAAVGDQHHNKPNIPLNNETLFNLGSVSKFIIMNMIMRLVQLNTLSLQDTVSQHLDDPDIPAKASICIQQLLHHYSGLQDRGFIHYTRNDSIKKILIPELIASPGEQFNYCNVNYIILCRIIEKVTGNSLENNLNKLILEPLGLHNIKIIDEDSANQNYAVGYKLNQKTLKLEHASEFYTWGAICFRATPSAMTTLIKNFFENHDYMPEQYKNQVLAACTEVQFNVNTASGRHSWPATIGLGIEKYLINKQVIYGHGGWQDSNAAFLAYSESTGKAFCVTCTKTQGLEQLAELKKTKRSIQAMITGKTPQSSRPKAEMVTVEANQVPPQELLL